MTRALPLSILSAAALLSGTAAFAATAKPAPRIVTAKTASGKVIHYDCSKPGNATKAACKK